MPYASGRVIHDADAHIMEMPGFLTEHLEAKYREQITDAVLFPRRDGFQSRLADAERAVGETFDDSEIMLAKNWSALGSWRRQDRPRSVDLLGFSSQLMFTTALLNFSNVLESGKDHGLAYAVARAHTRHMVDFCSVDRRLLATGYVPLADKATVASVKKTGNAQLAVPHLFQHLFPSWFTGIAFSAIVIGALVPAAIMAIAAANLFTRNIFKEFFKSDASPRLQTRVSQWVSLIVKVGALLFAVSLPKTFSINLQLLGGIWILQTFPSIVFGLFTRWFHRYALLAGWLTGMLYGTIAAYNVSTPTASHWAGSVDTVFGHTVYIGLTAIILNLAVSVILTLVLRTARVSAGTDETLPQQYSADPAEAPAPAPAAAAVGSEVRGGDLPSERRVSSPYSEAAG